MIALEKKVKHFTCSLFFYLLFSSAFAAPLAPASLPDIVEKILPSVVNISTVTALKRRTGGWEEFSQFWGIPDERAQTSLGSGVIIDASGLVLTNSHVVAEADEVYVTLKDKRSFQAQIIGRDSKFDIALLQIRDKRRKVPSDLQFATLGNSDPLRIAEQVVAIGNPFGLQHTVTLGIISAKNRTIGVGPFDNYLQTDASINPGNSGGPLFNLKGEVIGINTLIYSRTGQSGGLGFAIPINEIIRILPDLKQFGRVPRGWLGVVGEQITPLLARYYSLPRDEGVILINLVRNGPADHIGLQQGDIIYAIGGEPVRETLDIERLFGKNKPGTLINLSVLRGKKEIKIQMKIEELPRRFQELPQGVI
jgi:serine protease Do